MTFRRSRDLSAAGWLAAGRPVHVMKIEGGSKAPYFVYLIPQRRPYFRTIVTTTSTPALPTKGVKAQEVTGGRAGGDAVSLTSVYW